MSDFDNYLAFVRIFLIEDLKKGVAKQQGREWCYQQAKKVMEEAKRAYEAEKSI